MQIRPSNDKEQIEVFPFESKKQDLSFDHNNSSPVGESPLSALLFGGRSPFLIVPQNELPALAKPPYLGVRFGYPVTLDHSPSLKSFTGSSQKPLPPPRPRPPLNPPPPPLPLPLPPPLPPRPPLSAGSFLALFFGFGASSISSVSNGSESGRM